MDNIKEILQKLQNKQNIFLTGGAGVGKTTITKKIIKHFEDDAKKVAKLASTGMASTLINGQTLHSFFDFGIASNIDELDQNSKMKISKKVKKVLNQIDLIVIDEISMVSDTLFDMIELRIDQAKFSGAILIVGDFLQLPPVVKGYEEVRFAFESKAWKNFNFEIITLTHIFRTDDVEFIKLLANIRAGYVDEKIHNSLNEYIKPLAKDLSDFTFLFGKNNSALFHNKTQLEFIENELFIKKAQVIKHLKSVSEKEIKGFMNDARIDDELELKIGVPVLFTRNSWNYFNGERGEIINVDDKYVYVLKQDRKVVKLETVVQEKKRWVEKNIDEKKQIIEESTFSIYQYPIKLAFAITIHKSQGMSIQNLIIQTNEIFAPSQFYVALSRSSQPNRLNLIAPQKQWHEIIFVNNKALAFVNQGKN
jgi:ATP-dependent exoDNAse (exonuclease V) alpha subunit